MRQIPERTRRFFVLARWLILLASPFLIGLSEFHANPVIWLMVAIFAGMTIFFQRRLPHDLTTYDYIWYGAALVLDLLLVTAIVNLRGGLRTDAYLLYILVVNEAGLILGILPAVLAGIGSTVLYAGSVWLFHEPDPSRMVIRAIYMNVIGIVTAYMAASEKRALLDSVMDYKTQLPNYRHFSQMLEASVQSHRSHSKPLSIALVDVDDFKSLNQRIGHVYADRVLKQLASLLQANTRPSDLLARYGGEEFLLLLPGTDGPEAMRALSRLREVVAEHRFSPAPGVTVRLSVSIGVASLQKGSTPTELQIQADQALRMAKTAGKDCVRLYA